MKNRHVARRTGKPKVGLKKSTLKKSKSSQQRWLSRQLNDPYVRLAKSAGYRSRSAMKLEEINKSFKILQKGIQVVEFGAAPGGWTQVLKKYLGEKSKIVAVDLNDFVPLKNVNFIKADIFDPNLTLLLNNIIGKKVDGVLSDMAQPSTGNRSTDQLRSDSIVEATIDVTKEILKFNGFFCCKLIRGGGADTIFKNLKSQFKSASYFKPNASRSESKEVYVICQGYLKNN